MLSRLARTVLRAFGWRVVFDGLPEPRGIIIVYPHTSNWDFVLGLLTIWAIDLPVRWVGKESLFRGFTGATLGRLMRRWGGRPVDRYHATGAVEQLAALMRSEPWFWLALSCEGTRKYADHIRSGFYHLALRLDVPVGLASIDYRTHTVGVTQFERMSGEVERDLATLRAFFSDKMGLKPEQASRIVFRTDDALPKKNGA